jgi:hypothetical protein
MQTCSKAHSGCWEVKQPKHESNPSTPYNAHLKNEWSYTSAPGLSLHGRHKENFIPLLLKIYNRPREYP